MDFLRAQLVPMAGHIALAAISNTVANILQQTSISLIVEPDIIF